LKKLLHVFHLGRDDVRTPRIWQDLLRRQLRERESG